MVSREQIVEKIWGKDVYLDTDNAVNGAIRKIRGGGPWRKKKKNFFFFLEGKVERRQKERNRKTRIARSKIGHGKMRARQKRTNRVLDENEMNLLDQMFLHISFLALTRH